MSSSSTPLVRPAAIALAFLPFVPSGVTPRAASGITFTTTTSVALSAGLQQMREPLLLSGKGSALPGSVRIELDKVENAAGVVVPGDLLLVGHGGKAIAARPSLRTYADLTAPFQDQLAPLTEEAGDQLHAGDVPGRFEHVGAGEKIDGRATEQYRLETQYAADMPGHSVSVRIVIDVWAARLPVAIDNPLLSFGTASDSPIGAFRRKIASAFAGLGDATPVKTVITTTLSVGDITHEIVQTTTVTDVRPANLDPAALGVPAGYSASAR